MRHCPSGLENIFRYLGLRLASQRIGRSTLINWTTLLPIVPSDIKTHGPRRFGGSISAVGHFISKSPVSGIDLFARLFSQWLFTPRALEFLPKDQQSHGFGDVFPGHRTFISVNTQQSGVNV